MRTPGSFASIRLHPLARLALVAGLVVAPVAGSALAAGANDAPTIRITTPVDCGLVEPDGNLHVLITAEAEDSDGWIVAVRFYTEWYDGFCSVDSIAPYAASCRVPIIIEDGRSPFPSLAGSAPADCACDIASYQWETKLYAVAVDNEGATTSSDTIRVRPTHFGNGPPVGSLLTLPDPGFEATALADGAIATGPGVLGGWTFAGTAGATLGVLNPTAADYPEAAGNGTPLGADGANVAFLAVPAGDADSAHVFQALPDTLRTYSRYWLQLGVGSPSNAAPEAVSPFDGARFELRAGSTVIAQGVCGSHWEVGRFFDLQIFATSDQLPEELIGEPLSVHVRLGAGATARAVQFDRVRLHRQRYVTPGVGVPEGSFDGGLTARVVPNPAFATAAIEFVLAGEELVTLTLFDAAGRTVGAPVRQRLAAGPQRLALPAGLASGLYFARIDAGARSQTVRVVRLSP